MQGVPFIKMHGLGNDFVIIDGRSHAVKVNKAFLRAVADRKRGVGFDQLVILRPPASPQADIFMEIYNADASTVRACGNATRCVARLMFDETGRAQGVIETVAGLLRVWEENPGLISVDFGAPRLEWQQIPLARDTDTLHVPVSCGGISDGCCVNVGNPHAVFFVPDIHAVPLHDVGPALENDALFPDRCNIEIAQILAPDHIRMRVWERGAGITEACGSGAVATLVAAVRRGLTDRRATITLDGGDLAVEWRDDGSVVMTGAASLSYRGILSDELMGLLSS
ncbi:MAG: diaminopimelate epimerase [Alphaproteobacteria bacterium]|nr:diaminopimelate epimerase [Alphaproteobacteria bacterium]